MMLPLRRSLLLTLLVLPLFGCGFQLKGTGLDSSSLTGVPIALISADPRGELAEAVTDRLALAGAELVEPGPDRLILQVGPEVFEQRNLSLSVDARAAEIELTLKTRFSLREGEQQRVEATEAFVVRQMLNDPANVVGKTEELRLFREEMRRDLAAQIVRRVSHSLDI